MKSRGRSPVAALRVSSSMTSAAAAANRSGSSSEGGGGGNDKSLMILPPASSTSAVVGLATASASGDNDNDNNELNNHSVYNVSTHSIPNTMMSTTSNSNNESTTLGNSVFYDDDISTSSVLGSGSSKQEMMVDPIMTQKAIEILQAKITRCKQMIKMEQNTRDDNVNEYLKLSTNADRHQQGRIKQVFEKKNQKSAQNIAQHQKKLDEYQKRLKDIEEFGLPPKQPTQVLQGLKNVGGNIRDGTISIISKPKEFAHLLRHKFGSADNLSSLAKEKDKHHGSASLPREKGSEGTTTTARGSLQSSFEYSSSRKCISDDGRRSDNDEDNDHLESESSESNKLDDSSINPNSSEWKTVMQELTLQKEEVDHLREEIDEIRKHFKQAIETLNYQVREERDRYERLEEQMNDLTELHQHEIENIKSGVNDMEEKVQYQSEERLLDIKEHLQSLETKITSMEHQQAQQQYLNIEGLDSTDARAIMMKLLTAALTVLHVVLFVVGVVMNIAKPFLKSTSRIVFTATLVLAFVFVNRQWTEFSSFLLRIRQQWRTSNS